MRNMLFQRRGYACHREGVDSLFDASLFEVVPTPVAAAKVGEGQLDIFGNVVSADSFTESIEPPTAVDPPEVVGESDGEIRIEAEELTTVIEDVDLDDPDFDPGDVLNDPRWEPPIDTDVEVDTDTDVQAEVEADVAEPALETAVPEVGETETRHALIAPEDIVHGPSKDRIWTDIVGQPAAVDLLRAAAQQPIHAYLFVGPAGSGRRRAARSFAAALLCPAGGCGTCNACVRALDARHPDLVEVERDGASITVDQAREIIRLAMRSPIEGDRKVIVLVDFHLVSNAAPTLLKIIEEPPPSTVFVILADQLTNELVTIASRCMEVRFSPLSSQMVIETLIAEGATAEHAARIAKASGGRLDRARLLVQDPQFQSRLEFWESVPRRVDGTGAAVSVLAAEALVMIDGAAIEPLEARHAEELAALEERLETTGVRGGAGMKKELQERQKRELKRLRDDELKFGLGVLQQVYRQALTNRNDPNLSGYVEAIGLIGRTTDELIRNPNVTLLLVSVFAKLLPVKN
jgi:DNA polymerase III subunit delta'